MGRKDLNVSIIIVAYKHPELLQRCLQSVFKQNTQPFEVIVIDNSPTNKLQDLVRDFTSVRYFWSANNLGYGGGNNLGAKKAKGKYLLFLNPDTELYSGVIEQLCQFLEANNRTAIAAPTLVDSQGKRFPEQGAAKLTPFSAIASGSVFHAMWPSNPWANHYWMKSKNIKQDRKLSVVPGAAFIIRKKVFKQVGGFDEQFFLYFEEHDLCQRVTQAGWEIWQLAKAKVKHQWEGTTRDLDTKPIFEQSRFKYFRKYYGLGIALLTESILRIQKTHLLILFLFILMAILKIS